MFFGVSGSRNIRKQITFSLTPPAILKKTARKEDIFHTGIPHKNKEIEDGDTERRGWGAGKIGEEIFAMRQSSPGNSASPMWWARKRRPTSYQKPLLHNCGRLKGNRLPESALAIESKIFFFIAPIHPCHNSVRDGRIMASPSLLEKTSLSFQNMKILFRSNQFLRY